MADRPQNHQHRDVPTFVDDIDNHLHPIQADVDFINQVLAAFPSSPLVCTSCTYCSISDCHFNWIPWLTDLRCGASYALPSYTPLPQSPSTVKCYVQAHPTFPPHMHTSRAQMPSRKLGLKRLNFNLHRPNIRLLSVAATHGGYVAITNTRSSHFSEKISFLVPESDSARAGKRCPMRSSRPYRSGSPSSTALHACAASSKHRRSQTSRRRRISISILTCVRHWEQ